MYDNQNLHALHSMLPLKRKATSYSRLIVPPFWRSRFAVAEGVFENISAQDLRAHTKASGYTQVEIRAPHAVAAGMEAAQMWRRRR